MIIQNEVSALASALDGRKLSYTRYGPIWDSALQQLIPITGHYLIEALSGADVRFRLTVPTACITAMEQIWINPQFFIDNIETSEDLAAILLHELLHPWVDPGLIRLGPVWNIIQDIAINCIIYNLSPKLAQFFHKMYSPEYYTCLLTDKGLSVMMDIQKKWPLQSKVLSLNKEELAKYIETFNFKTLKNKENETISFSSNLGLLPIGPLQIKTYESLYHSKDSSFSNSIPIEVIREVFFPQLSEVLQGNGKYVITDGQGQQVDGDSIIGYSNIKGQTPEEIEKAAQSKDAKDLNEILDQQATEIKEAEKSKNDVANKAQSSTSASKSGSLDYHKTVIRSIHDLNSVDRVQGNYSIIHSTYTSINKSSRSSVFKKTLERAFSETITNIAKYSPSEQVSLAFKASALTDVRNTIVDHMAFKTTSSRTIVPLQIPKRGMTNLALGYLPTWYKKNNPSPQTQEAVKSIVYMDVSGSFISYIPWTLGLITAMKDRCNTEKLFVFSTELYQTSMQEVSEGKYKSTGGTSFQIVLDHFLQSPEKKALMITDGYDSVSKDMGNKLKEQGKQIFVLIIGNYLDPNNHLDWATKTFNYIVKE